MDLQIIWSILFSCLILQMNCDPYLSKQDLALLSAEPYPACFTRSLEDFTCFWEAPVGKSYDFLYKADEDHNAERACNLSQQETTEGKILYACFFQPLDVFLLEYTHVRVVDKDTNTTVYTRKLNVEDNCLFYPPSDVSLHPTGKEGQILVKWTALSQSMKDHEQYELRYTSKALEETVKLKKVSICEHALLSLVPGQPCTVQIRVKASFNDAGGHWSDWSSPVTALVPQNAADIEFTCHTSDLHQVWCQWNKEHYKYMSLHYRQTNRNSWGNWKSCDQSNVSAGQCIIYGDEWTMFQLYLTAPHGLLNQTFYMDEFWMNSSIKTVPPEGLMEEIIGERLCLKWSSPFPKISEHLMYQVRYQVLGENDWKVFTVQTPSTRTCLDVQASGQYTIQVKAKPSGLFYSGDWSDWSKPLTKQLTSNSGLLFIACIPFAMLIISVVLLTSFSRYASKLKQVLWPPVPNLNDVLESFLKDINRQDWEPNISIKQCDDDTPASVVEIMSEKDTQTIKKPSKGSYFPQYQLAVDSNKDCAMQGLEMTREYVILKSSPAHDISCLAGNDYVYGVNAASNQVKETVCSYTSLCSDTFPASTTNILNQSYLQAEVGSELHNIIGRYTNLENVATIKEE
ncbi:thrombopoietin receptor precursor [Silurus asotus]|uniref:Thrombopoietin receptor n=1 Tax=Silurus asotus TaxID=30991 RepID=A0AAD5ADA5_SILAS|nr:thrombopoietin receptor precursor [Silurus asotus]